MLNLIKNIDIIIIYLKIIKINIYNDIQTFTPIGDMFFM